MIGTILDRRYQLGERLAEGGYGAVYRAIHVKSGHAFAIKVLLPEHAQDLGVLARFRREADALTALRSPHTVAAYELGETADHTLFMVMELLTGESLVDHLRTRGKLPWHRVLAIADGVCDSLVEAHARGIVHRDLKPGNIHLAQADGAEVVKVLDFGIAKILGGGDLTNAGEMVGSLDYMSPEQMVGGEVTGQSDLYTLGIVMYEMLAGHLPFGEAMNATTAMAAIMRGKPAPLDAVPEELDRIVRRCLEREAARRFADVGELRAALAAIPPPAAVPAPRPIYGDDEPTTLRPEWPPRAPSPPVIDPPALRPRAPTHPPATTRARRPGHTPTPLPLLPPVRDTPVPPPPTPVPRPAIAPRSATPLPRPALAPLPATPAPRPPPPVPQASEWPQLRQPPPPAPSSTTRRALLIVVLALAAVAGALLAGLMR